MAAASLISRKPQQASSPVAPATSTPISWLLSPPSPLVSRAGHLRLPRHPSLPPHHAPLIHTTGGGMTTSVDRLEDDVARREEEAPGSAATDAASRYQGGATRRGKRHSLQGSSGGAQTMGLHQAPTKRRISDLLHPVIPLFNTVSVGFSHLSA